MLSLDVTGSCSSVFFFTVMCFVLYIINMSSTYLVYNIIFCVSSIRFRCLFSRSCRNISAVILDMGDPMEIPFSCVGR